MINIVINMLLLCCLYNHVFVDGYIIIYWCEIMKMYGDGDTVLPYDGYVGLISYGAIFVQT